VQYKIQKSPFIFWQ